VWIFFWGVLAVEMAALLEAENETIEFVGLIDPWPVFFNTFSSEDSFKNMMRELQGANAKENLIALSW
jgi:thioesterase domain-containing protein